MFLARISLATIAVVLTVALAIILLLPLTLAYLVNVTSHVLGVVGYRVQQVYLVDYESHRNLTYMNLLITSITSPRKLVVIAHTTSNHIVLSDNISILQILLVIGGYADVIYVNGTPRIGLSKYYARLLGIKAEVLEYYTCYPTTLTYVIESSTYKKLGMVELYTVLDKLNR